MTYLLKNYALSLLLLSAFALQAEDAILPRQAVPTKVAYVDINKIMNENLTGSHEFRDRVTELQSELKDRYNKIQSEVARGQKLEAEVRNPDKSKWASSESRESKTEELMKLQKNLEISAQAAESYQMKKFQEIQNEIVGKIEKIAKEIAVQQGWDLVIVGGGIYVNPRVDITDDVLSALNKAYKPTKKAAPKPAAKTIKPADAA